MTRFDRPRMSRDARHSVVYRNDQEFSSWPFYNGLWKLPNGDLMAGFKVVPCVYSDSGEVHHDNIAVSKGHIVTLLSRDGGASWDASTLDRIMDYSRSPDDVAAENPKDYSAEAPVDFTDKNVLIMSGAMPALFTPNSKAWLRLSTDAGKSWRHPIFMPMTGLSSLTAYGSTVTRPDGVNLLFMSTVTRDGWTRRPLVYASTDGRQWNFLSFMTPQKDDGQSVSDKIGSPRFGAHRYVYTRPLMLKDGRIVAAIRCQRDPTGLLWTEMHESEDGGRTWHFMSRVNDWGAPADLVQLSDGRLLAVYGYRLPAFGVRYRVSEDGGRTWGSEVILRNDAGSWDCGYPRVIEHEAGKCLAIYYINLKGEGVLPVRHIAQTVFTPE